MAKNILSILFLLVVITNIYSLPLNDTCTTKNFVGTCIPLESCPTAIALAKVLDVSTLRSMVCQITPKKKVCCPQEVESIIFFNDRPQNNGSSAQTMPNKSPTLGPKEITTVLESTTTKLDTTTMETKEITEELPQSLKLDPFPDRSICGTQMGTSSRIVGGVISEIDEFPWLARIAYRQRDGSVRFDCAASLITDRYLITAAHCLISKTILGVRLGEWDEQTSIDCKQGQCIDKPVDRKILKTIIFPGYNYTQKTYGDIALIELEKPVKFTEYIRPICLPTTEYVKMQDYVDGSSYWAAGWGITEYETVSSIKRKVNLDAVSSEVCHAIYPGISKLSLSNIICAGGRLGKDTCSGDSGGPLMKPVQENYRENWYIYGIISLGHDHCGSEGQPGFYTRVTKYMDWIRETIRN